MQIRVVAGMMISVVALGVSGLHIVDAQAPARESISVAMAIPQVSSGLNAKVSLNLQGATLDQAIHAIARQADLKVTLGEDVFRASRRVTLRVAELSARDALEQVIAGTGIAMSAVSSNQVVFVKGVGARADGTITGKIVNAKTKQPMSGVTVTLGEATKGVTTGADGTFRLVAPAGEQTLYIRSLGFVRQQRKVNVPEGQTITMDIALEQSASVLDEVVVTGTVVATERKAIPTPITVITAEELEQRGITRIEQLFRGEVPGLFVKEQGAETYSTSAVGKGVSSAIYSRGSADINGGANPIKTYIDGVELLDPSYLGTIDPRSIEKIEIVTGPQAATIYGSGAMGGVMQIFTKRGGGDGISDITLSVKYGILQNNFSDGKTPEHHDVLTVNGGSGIALSYSGSLSYDYTGQWQPKLYNGRLGAALGATHTRNRLTISASLSNSTTRQGTWKAGFGSYGYLQLLTSPDAQYRGEAMAVRYYSDRISTSSNQTVSLNADYRATDAWQHHVTLGRSQNSMTLKPAAPDYAGDGNAVGSDTLFQTARASGQRLTWNYNTSYVSSLHWLASSLTLGANGSVGDQLSVEGSLANPSSSTIIGWRADAAPRVTLPINDKSWGSFASWQIGFWGRLYTTIGLRIEQNPNYGSDVKFDFTPTNGLTYTIEYGDLSVKLMGSYGRATRPPSPDQRLERLYNSAAREPSQYVGRFANPELRPEYSRGPQGGIEIYYGNLGSLTVNHYSQKVTDLIQQVPVDSFQYVQLSNGNTYWYRQTQFRNVATVRQMGWEGTASLNAGPVTLKGVYSWNDSRVLYFNSRASNIYQTTGVAFTGVPTHTGNVSVMFAHGATRFSLVTNIVGRRIVNFNYDRNYQETRLARIPTYGDRGYGYQSPLARFFNQPGYAKSDLAVSHRISPRTSLLLNMVNLGNSFASDGNALNPALGRQTTLGFSYRFGQR